MYAILAVMWFLIATISGNSDFWVVGAVFIVAFEVEKLRKYFEEAEE